ncbi:hypothetical protein IJD44_01925 [bacterium]|nr:hypothetical protein [bacterium]
MKGCFSFIIKTIIVILVFFGLVHLGVIDYIKTKISEKKSVSQKEMVDKTKDVVDLSGIDDEYKISTNFKFLKHRMIVADHGASSQKMIIIETPKQDILTKDDIKGDNAQEKIQKALEDFKYKPVKFSKIEVTKKGEFTGLGQKIPYAKVDVEIANLPIKDMEGIVGVVELENGKNLVVISANEKGKYSQIITDAFYEKVK